MFGSVVKSFLTLSVLLNIVFLGLYYFERKTTGNLQKQLTACQVNFEQLNNQFLNLNRQYTELKSKCELNIKQLTKQYSNLLQRYNQKIKSFEQLVIPNTDNDCEAMKVLIDNYLELTNKNQLNQE